MFAFNAFKDAKTMEVLKIIAEQLHDDGRYLPQGQTKR